MCPCPAAPTNTHRVLTLLHSVNVPLCLLACSSRSVFSPSSELAASASDSQQRPARSAQSGVSLRHRPPSGFVLFVPQLNSCTRLLVSAVKCLKPVVSSPSRVRQLFVCSLKSQIKRLTCALEKHVSYSNGLLRWTTFIDLVCVRGSAAVTAGSANAN